MAKLVSDNLTFEFRFKEYDDCNWVDYEILFLWDGKPIINDKVLKRHNEHWNKRVTGAFRANEHLEDSFIDLLEDVLKTNKPDYWEPLEPDIVIAFYPDMYFPFLEPHGKVIYERENIKKERLEREARKRANNNKLPDDAITMIAFVDCYNFDSCCAYCGEGPALIMQPTREELEIFCKQLKKEYDVFQEKYNIQDKIKEYHDEEREGDYDE